MRPDYVKLSDAPANFFYWWQFNPERVGALALAFGLPVGAFLLGAVLYRRGSRTLERTMTRAACNF